MAAAPRLTAARRRGLGVERGGSTRKSSDYDARMSPELTDAPDDHGRSGDARRGAVVAEFSQAGLGTYRVYEDGAIELEYWTAAGQSVSVESIVGATARVERLGSRKLFRDNRRAFLTIRGPQVAISVEIDNYANVAASVQRFAAEVNELAQRLAPPTTNAPADASVPDQIAELAQLRDQGVLTNDEFEAKKAELLQRM
jgi:hypothetical protein